MCGWLPNAQATMMSMSPSLSTSHTVTPLPCKVMPGGRRVAVSSTSVIVPPGDVWFMSNVGGTGPSAVS
jgi:hypothetical protein